MRLQLLTLVSLVKLTWTLILVDMLETIATDIKVAGLCILRVVPVACPWMQLRKALRAYAREHLWLVLLPWNAWLSTRQASWSIHTLLTIVRSLVRCGLILWHILEDYVVPVDWKFLILRPPASLNCMQQVLATFFQLVLSRQARVARLF